MLWSAGNGGWDEGFRAAGNILHAHVGAGVRGVIRLLSTLALCTFWIGTSNSLKGKKEKIESDELAQEKGVKTLTTSIISSLSRGGDIHSVEASGGVRIYDLAQIHFGFQLGSQHSAFVIYSRTSPTGAFERGPWAKLRGYSGKDLSAAFRELCALYLVP